MTRFALNGTREERIHTRHKTHDSRGWATYELKCPFCETWVTVYRWSLYGSGKLCPECGAHHHGLGAVTWKKLGIDKAGDV